MYTVNICGMKNNESKVTTITIGPFENSELAVNEAESLAYSYYRINYLELPNKEKITQFVWNLED